MFKSLLKRIFPSLTKEERRPNFEYFSQGTANADPVEEEVFQAPIVEQVEQRRILSRESLEQEFLSHLFKPQPNGANIQLCEFIKQRVEFAIVKPKQLVSCLPVMPLSLVTIIDELKKDEFDTNLLLDIINREPTIAAKVIELANSSYYRRSDKDITDLKSAFMVMGTNGLLEGVINEYINKFKPAANIYYKQFGEKIWQHSLATGIQTRHFLQKSGLSDLAATGYFVGLILHLGHMIIFQLMLEAFSYVDPDARPDKQFFTEVIQRFSIPLTLAIAKHWQLPKSIIETIVIQHKLQQKSVTTKNLANFPVALYLFEANKTVMMKTLLDFKVIGVEECDNLANKLLISEASLLEISRITESRKAYI